MKDAFYYSAYPLIGRILLSAIFMMSGAYKIYAFEDVLTRMRHEGIVATTFFAVAALLLEIIGGLSVLIGYRARVGAALLIIFIVPVTLIMHDFWQYPEGFVRQQQISDFVKNLAILGGLFIVLGLGSGPLSIDARSRRKASSARESEGEESDTEEQSDQYPQQ